MDTKGEHKIAVATAAALLRGGILDRVRYVCESQKTIRTGRLSKLVEKLEEDLKVYGIYVGSLADKLQSSRKREFKWHPIETAPKDGTRVLLMTEFGDCVSGYFGGGVRDGLGQWYGWEEPIDQDVTHWSYIFTPN